MAACVTCHENHRVVTPTDAMLGADAPGLCKNCHQAGDKGFEVGAQMLQIIRALDDQYQQARNLLQRAERAGMEISKPKFALNEAHERLIQARVLVHGVSLAPVQDSAREGLRIAGESHQAGLAAMKEIQYRRTGLLVSLGFILLTALALFLKIRSMEKRSA
jgi:predicted CXXCH cytochrome family protein